jgi:hypothetical protein
LANFVLQPNVVDQWVWRYDPGGGYSVRGAYEILTAQDAQETASTSDLIWDKQIPMKVSVMAWRLLRNRLPTKDNLVRWHVIHPDAGLCVIDRESVETAHHLFISCPIFAPLWSLIRSWVGFSSSAPLFHANTLVMLYLGGLA